MAGRFKNHSGFWVLSLYFDCYTLLPQVDSFLGLRSGCVVYLIFFLFLSRLFHMDRELRSPKSYVLGHLVFLVPFRQRSCCGRLASFIGKRTKTIVLPGAKVR